jgi:pimeloyl-ACP methyl ester carboxylesterase
MPYLAVNGLNVYYDERGDGTPLLLLHGGMATTPEKWLSFFAPHFRAIAPQQIGA